MRSPDTRRNWYRAITLNLTTLLLIWAATTPLIWS